MNITDLTLADILAKFQYLEQTNMYLRRQNMNLKEALKESQDRSVMYRTNLVEAHNKNKQLLNQLDTLLDYQPISIKV